MKIKWTTVKKRKKSWKSWCDRNHEQNMTLHFCCLGGGRARLVKDIQLSLCSCPTELLIPSRLPRWKNPKCVREMSLFPQKLSFFWGSFFVIFISCFSHPLRAHDSSLKVLRELLKLWSVSKGGLWRLFPHRRRLFSEEVPFWRRRARRLGCSRT